MRTWRNNRIEATSVIALGQRKLPLTLRRDERKEIAPMTLPEGAKTCQFRVKV